MPFPDAKRVIYNKNPLIQVVCQLRFPRILSINEREPVSFQERIKGEYQIYSVITELEGQFEFGPVNTDGTPPVPRVTQSVNSKNHRFSSDDGNWHVNLTPTVMALSTSKYSRWEDFNEKLKEPLSAFEDLYDPPFYERIGLRYVDAFRRSELGLEGVDWAELIQPSVSGFLSDEHIRGDINSYNSLTELDIGSGATAQIRSALGYVGGVENGFPRTNSELAFIIDSDMFFPRKNIDDLDASLAYLHDISTKLIRTMITDKLHDAMEPEEI